MGKPSPPPAPDYAAAAREQGTANMAAGQQTASLSNPNITNPYGQQTITYSPTGPNGDMQPNIVQSLNPQSQQTLDAQQRVQTGLANLGEQGMGVARGVLGSPFQYNGPGIQTSLGNVGSAQTSLGNYGQASAGPAAQGNLDLTGVAKMPVNAGVSGQQALLNRLQPQIAQRDAGLRQQLANQGLTAGGEAYTNSMRDENNANNDLYSQAALQGIGLDMSANQQGYNQAMGSAGLYNQALGQNFSQNLGAQGQNYSQALGAGQFANQGIGQNYNQALGSGQFGNTASAQSLQQQLGLYNQPLNQVTALMSGSQIQTPQFQQYQGANIGAAPVFQATQAKGLYDQNSYAQQMAGYNSMISGIAGVAGGAASGGFFGKGFG